MTSDSPARGRAASASTTRVRHAGATTGSASSADASAPRHRGRGAASAACPKTAGTVKRTSTDARDKIWACGALLIAGPAALRRDVDAEAAPRAAAAPVAIGDLPPNAPPSRT